jgi:sulfonate transport system ATP-binding protein
VLHGHPGRINQILTIDLPRPRRRTSSEFQAWKQRVLDALEPELVSA